MTGSALNRPGSWWARRSLRVRLTAAATVIIIVGMSGAAVLLVWRLHSSLLSNLDITTTQQVDTVAGEAAQGPLPRLLPTAGKEAPVIQVVGAGGQVVSRSVNAPGDERVFTFAGRSGKPAFATVQGVPVGDDASTLRVAALTTNTSSGAVTVYAGLPTDDLDQSVTELIAALAVGLPVIMVLLALVGWFLIGRALRPVELLRRQAAAIPGADLHRRLDQPSSADELGRLAATFNELLTRIETAAVRHRQFVADAAHELRSPLAALRTELEVAVRHPDATAIAALAPDLLADTVRLGQLADDLLQLARLDAHPPLKRQPVDLDDLLLEEIRRVRGRDGRIAAAGISAGRVMGDPSALGRVIQNLIDNAIRYARDTVTVELSAAADTVTLTVADDGPGIPPADRKRVFERFTRLDDARSRDDGGSGLGLAIVHDVVAAHGGRIHVENNHPGARISISLPTTDD